MSLLKFEIVCKKLIYYPCVCFSTWKIEQMVGGWNPDYIITSLVTSRHSGANLSTGYNPVRVEYLNVFSGFIVICITFWNEINLIFYFSKCTLCLKHLPFIQNIYVATVVLINIKTYILQDTKNHCKNCFNEDLY